MSISIVHPDIDKYLHELEDSASRSDTLKAMEAYARERHFPIVGPLVGRAMSSMALAINAKRVLELGSGFGYSAIWFAQAIGSDGRIVCTDGDEQNHKLALENFEKAGIETPVDFHVGDALTISKTLNSSFDIIFCDIDKHEYPDVIEEVVRLLRPGGLFFTDNVLWSGRVLEPMITDRNTVGIRLFNETLFQDSRFSTTILPIRDGVALAVKK